MTTDVAEQVTPTEQTPPPEDVVETPSPPTTASDGATTASENNAGTEANPDAGTEGADSGLDYGALLDEVLGAEASTPEAQASPPEALPGLTLEQERERADAIRARNYRTVIDTSAQQFAALIDEAGLDDATASKFWQFTANAINSIHGNNGAYSMHVLDEAIKRSLPEAQRKEYENRKYANEHERLQAFSVLSKADERASWEGQKKARKLFSDGDVKKLVQDAYNRGRGVREQSGEQEGTNEGAGVRGKPPTNNRLTKERFMAMTPAERAQLWREKPEEVSALK